MIFARRNTRYTQGRMESNGKKEKARRMHGIKGMGEAESVTFLRYDPVRFDPDYKATGKEESHMVVGCPGDGNVIKMP